MKTLKIFGFVSFKKLATCILLSGQSNLSFKTVSNKHLLNMYMNDAQANKRNEAEKERTAIIFRSVNSRACIVQYALLLHR